MRERYIPAGYTLAHEAPGITIYRASHTKNGRPVSLGYAGKQSKPLFHTIFTGPESQAAFEEGYIMSAAARVAEKEAFRKARLAPGSLSESP